MAVVAIRSTPWKKMFPGRISGLLAASLVLFLITAVEVAVCDTGAGLAPDVADRLFQPFVTTKQQGMGIGLSLCRTIIESHGGSIRAAPNPEGGTIFSFTLPAETIADDGGSSRY